MDIGLSSGVRSWTLDDTGTIHGYWMSAGCSVRILDVFIRILRLGFFGLQRIWDIGLKRDIGPLDYLRFLQDNGFATNCLFGLLGYLD
jgi:hypothetical protein